DYYCQVYDSGAYIF
nr:immunoglobulin light chain junction region [Macaca mulatta]MOX17338.1 immunoglobulin light chain junction region [Macaca mulatta]MOX17689.1 immunoglobulin light chain junction region [Macaca mulatta]MOX18403.1 immunoglobulin light chain junction region [Macaca mulatta]MOX18473.1 immunoglobulin light chain junction region [Macaca mulatta]